MNLFGSGSWPAFQAPPQGVERLDLAEVPITCSSIYLTAFCFSPSSIWLEKRLKSTSTRFLFSFLVRACTLLLQTPRWRSAMAVEYSCHFETV